MLGVVMMGQVGRYCALLGGVEKNCGQNVGSNNVTTSVVLITARGVSDSTK